MKALQAICKVSEELAKDGIKKDRNNAQQGYKFRGIDDCLNALAPLMAKHGLVIMPECLERSVQERESRNGGMLFYVTVKVKYKFYSTEDGTSQDAIVYGEAMDSADKATNKSMSAAYKYAVIQTFCIPTEGDNDADATTHELAPNTGPMKYGPPPSAFAQQRKTIAKAFQDIRQDIKEMTAPAFTPTEDHECPIPDVTWGEFLEYVGDDPERTKIGKKVKQKMAIQEMRSVPPAQWKGIMLSIQDEAKRQGVPFTEWVKE